MRVLFSALPNSGHFLPMAPFIGSMLAAGHEVMVASAPGFQAQVAATGADFWPVGHPSPESLAPDFERLVGLTTRESNDWMVGEFFGRIRPTAALPRLREALTSWQPQLVLRDSAEFGSSLAAEQLGVPVGRIAIGLGAAEEFIVAGAASSIDTLRTGCGLPADPGLTRIRHEPYLTLFPAGLEDPAIPDPVHIIRFRNPSWTPLAAEAASSGLVYVTLGSEAGHMPGSARVYSEAMAAVADVDREVLLTTGSADPAWFRDPPPNVRVERWVDQAQVLAGASAVICHGGGGTTLGALAAGVPLVMVPLFAQDQHINAGRVAAVGVGVSVVPERDAIRSGLSAVLQDESFRTRARALAAELRGQHGTDDAIDLLAADGLI
jgi:UDP:flavonoid glycosyltransferase YjiC (YdhE family)